MFRTSSHLREVVVGEVGGVMFSLGSSFLESYCADPIDPQFPAVLQFVVLCRKSAFFVKVVEQFH